MSFASVSKSSKTLDSFLYSSIQSSFVHEILSRLDLATINSLKKHVKVWQDKWQSIGLLELYDGWYRFLRKLFGPLVFYCYCWL